MRLATLIFRRLQRLIPVLIGVSVVCFALIRVLPGDPILLIVPETATAEDIERTRIRYGLDRPIVVQYWDYMSGVVQGDFGTSIQTNRPVAEEVRERLPRTLELVGYGFLCSLLLALCFGFISAYRPGKPIDHSSRMLALAGNSLPEFWFALILILVFFGFLGWAPPPIGRIGTDIDIIRVTGFMTLDAIITGNWSALVSALHHLMLPVLTLGIVAMAPMMRTIRASAMEVLNSSGYRCAASHGLSSGRLFRNYVLRESLVPLPVLGGLVFGNLIGGSVLVEYVFSWQGFGQWALRGLLLRDYPVIQSFVLIIAGFYVVIFLIADVVQAILDPRIKF
ncbi:MAG: peptide ABC transporter permease [Acidiferrobacteraceae bacterium]|nr:peptide ABC transporter permease [Acidiferrobacteraceae bacterium]